MKTLDIALKDLRQSFRSTFALVFMFVIPLLTVGLFYFAFGGLAGEEGGGFQLPSTRVVLANQDEPAESLGGFSAGALLADFLSSDELADLLTVEAVDTPEAAREAVLAQNADVAVLIPAGFTAAAFETGGRTTVELYHDPTLTLGPGIVQALVNQFVDGFAGAKIAVDVTSEQLSDRGAAPSPATLERVAQAYAAWAQSLGESSGGEGAALIAVRAPAGERTTTDLLAQILSPIMAGMMIFYAFFTGASTAQSILREDEAGTLPRLFTTPTDEGTILTGKLLAVFLTVLVQVVVLVAVAPLFFDVQWGAWIPLSAAVLGLVLLAASFGVFLNSLLKSTQQAGLVFGGVMTVTGMIGISPVMVGGVSATSQAARIARTLSLSMPQGWATRAWIQLSAGAALPDVLLSASMMLALAVIFFVIGVARFRRRFA